MDSGFTRFAALWAGGVPRWAGRVAERSLFEIDFLAPAKPCAEVSFIPKIKGG